MFLFQLNFIAIALATLPSTQADPIVYGICQTGCNAGVAACYAACYTAAGFTFNRCLRLRSEHPTSVIKLWKHSSDLEMNYVAVVLSKMLVRCIETYKLQITMMMSRRYTRYDT
ncbi:hypothetical protein K435DRAFT_913255 [Dendrothele bispora CBS 962.96]|uniref:Uncharacterized protein n=1 Tax=Dendrothele bispora (strain CBS 962.96) TaxID=1314807 RepID=A0A4S8MKZ6_DENBC|nr:hypothetical protein K435DRAFT_913255 [Dendrothele bispora CBS 962.96]